MLLLWFFSACAFSILLAPDVDINKNTLFLRDCMSFMYLAYWFSVYLFFRKWFWAIDLKLLSYSFLAGMCMSCMFIIIGSTESSSYSLGPFSISQNSYAVNSVAFIGIAMWQVYRRFRNWGLIAIGAIFLGITLMSQSRSGAIIIFLQFVIVMSSSLLAKNVEIRRLVLGASIAMAILVGFFTSGSTAIGEKLGGVIAPYNPELALLIARPEEALQNDKSWLIRKVQVEKGLGLFYEHPLSGVGYRHFTSVMGDVNIHNYSRLKSRYEGYALSRSSHNSHIQVLSETGLMGFVPFLLINVLVFWEVTLLLMRRRSSLLSVFLGTSLIGVTAYFWTISAVTGAMWYVALGLFVGSIGDKGRRSIHAGRNRKKEMKQSCSLEQHPGGIRTTGKSRIS
ncbi:O-antigen ligase family protein [Akkermansiaceae bacterium]|nr:O-antigen ligase family protein [Akkermansiaceae bacterium]